MNKLALNLNFSPKKKAFSFEYSFKNYSEALMKFTQALDLANKSKKEKYFEPLYYGKALCFFQEGDFKNSLQLFEKSNDLIPNDPLNLYYHIEDI